MRWDTTLDRLRCQRWLWDEQSTAASFPRLPEDRRNDLRGGIWASPRNLNLIRHWPFRRKKATRQLQADRISERGVGWQNLEAPDAGSSCTPAPRDTAKLWSDSGAESQVLSVVLPSH